MGGPPLIWPTEGTPYNETFISYNDHLYNNTLLNHFNYTFYSNGTLSNGTKCVLAFPPYSVPLVMFPNGTFHNNTSCDAAILPISIRGGLGIAFGVLHALLLVLCLSCLRKHGKNHLPVDRNFRLVSRRWQWYWFSVTSAVSMISCFTAIDVDRNYTQNLALILTNFFYYIALPAMLASVWEMCRHWGSFCERLTLDEDSFRYLHGDTRSKIELYTPLGFYLWAFLTFFLSNLRSWTPIPKAFSNPHRAIATATDNRFKAASIFPVIGILICLWSLAVTWYYYPPYSRRIPIKIPLCLILICVRIGYNIAVAWDYNIGPLKWDSSLGLIYGLGYAPIIAVMCVMVWAGYREENDDLVLKEERKKREKQSDKELGIGGKGTQPGVRMDTVSSGDSKNESERGLTEMQKGW